METKDRTLERLQYLEALYRRGYRSDVVDRSLDKIIALERAAARRELADLQERLRAFEARYQIGEVGIRIGILIRKAKGLSAKGEAQRVEC